MDLTMPQDVSTPLSGIRPTKTVVIQRVKTDDVDLLRYLEDLGLVPGSQVDVIDYSTYDDNLTVQIGRQVAVLGLNITTKIYVEKI
jgi:DtxR family Mn-dependent transcriptional regulator